jgi:hypothetical protein
VYYVLLDNVYSIVYISATQMRLIQIITTFPFMVIFYLCMICEESFSVETKYTEPEVKEARFDKDTVNLLKVDRDKLASSVAAYVVNSIMADADAIALDAARRLLGFALHLSPRNRDAVIANFQFKKGLPRKKIQPEYSPVTLAEVLQSRATFLIKNGGELNVALAGYMLSVAVQVDSTNETAIYELEMYRKDIGSIDWSSLVGEEPKVKEPK